MVSTQLNPTAATSSNVTQMAGVSAVPSQVLSLEDIVTIKAEAQSIDPVLARKIAFCESTTRQYGKDGLALRGLHNPDDVGLFQINEEYHGDKSKELGYDIYSTEGNIDYALWLIKNEGTRHWKWSRPCWG